MYTPEVAVIAEKNIAGPERRPSAIACAATVEE
jgi:hypothetical protein